MATVVHKVQIVRQDNRESLREIELTATAKFVVTSDDTASIQLISNDSLDESIRQGTSAQHFFLVHSPNRRELRGHIRFDDLPVPVAFDVSGRIQGRDVELSGVSASASGRRMPLSAAYDGPVVDRMDLHLQASPAVALRSLDIFTIWDGRIVFRDVPVIHAASPADVLRQWIAVQKCRIGPTNYRKQHRMTVEYAIADIMLDLAFDVLIRTDDGEFTIGRITDSWNEYSTRGQVTGDYDGPVSDRVDVILRSVSAGQIDDPRIVAPWQGEIIFDDMPVEVP